MEHIEFEKTIEWSQKHKAFKVYVKKDKNGIPFFMGSLNNTVSVLIQKVTGDYAKEGEYQVYFVPVTYKKKETPQSTVPEVEVGGGSSEIPF